MLHALRTERKKEQKERYTGRKTKKDVKKKQRKKVILQEQSQMKGLNCNLGGGFICLSSTHFRCFHSSLLKLREGS